MKNKYSKCGALIRTVIVLVLFLLGIRCHAQSWEWDDMTSWFRNQGVEILAVYAHTNADKVGYKIVSTTSSRIIVEIDFKGPLSNYTSKYEIVKGTCNEMAYFKTVRVMADDLLGTSFITWDSLPKFHSQIYSKFDSSIIYELYGSYTFDDLSLNKKAAFGLFIEFINYYGDSY